MDSEEYAAAFIVYYILFYPMKQKQHLVLEKSEKSGLSHGLAGEMNIGFMIQLCKSFAVRKVMEISDF